MARHRHRLHDQVFTGPGLARLRRSIRDDSLERMKTTMPNTLVPIRIVGLSGSLRSGSYNAQLLRAAVALAPDGVTITAGTIRGIPLYDGDVEAAEGIPPLVAALKDDIAAADGLLLVTPEYNNSIPGVFKNCLLYTSDAADE